MREVTNVSVHAYAMSIIDNIWSAVTKKAMWSLSSMPGNETTPGISSFSRRSCTFVAIVAVVVVALKYKVSGQVLYNF